MEVLVVKEMLQRNIDVLQRMLLSCIFYLQDNRCVYSDIKMTNPRFNCNAQIVFDVTIIAQFISIDKKNCYTKWKGSIAFDWGHRADMNDDDSTKRILDDSNCWGLDDRICWYHDERIHKIGGLPFLNNIANILSQ